MHNKMALAAALGSGGFSNGSLGLASIDFQKADAKDAELLTLQRELGVLLQDKRSTATINAFADPKKALENYQDERKKIEVKSLEI